MRGLTTDREAQSERKENKGKEGDDRCPRENKGRRRAVSALFLAWSESGSKQGPTER